MDSKDRESCSGSVRRALVGLAHASSGSSQKIRQRRKSFSDSYGSRNKCVAQRCQRLEECQKSQKTDRQARVHRTLSWSDVDQLPVDFKQQPFLRADVTRNLQVPTGSLERETLKPDLASRPTTTRIPTAPNTFGQDTTEKLSGCTADHLKEHNYAQPSCRYSLVSDDAPNCQGKSTKKTKKPKAQGHSNKKNSKKTCSRSPLPPPCERFANPKYTCCPEPSIVPNPPSHWVQAAQSLLGHGMPEQLKQVLKPPLINALNHLGQDVTKQLQAVLRIRDEQDEDYQDVYTKEFNPQRARNLTSQSVASQLQEVLRTNPKTVHNYAGQDVTSQLQEVLQTSPKTVHNYAGQDVTSLLQEVLQASPQRVHNFAGQDVTSRPQEVLQKSRPTSPITGRRTPNAPLNTGRSQQIGHATQPYQNTWNAPYAVRPAREDELIYDADGHIAKFVVETDNGVFAYPGIPDWR